ncbi:MAG: glycoside hydrolase family 140 protein [Bacteroidetes bacterium]|nr:glycoside hydrolase family 140 protein [Bacteroidota bacterium]
MRIYIISFLIVLLVTAGHAQTNHGRIQVTPDGHYLQYEDGTPFFWLGDTGWELFHRLDLPEIKKYLDNRAAKEFNVIQAVALAEFDGLTRPNRYGELPLKNLDPTQPNEKYFAVIDSTIKMAKERNIFIGLLPTWGDKVTKMWGTGPVVFDSVNAYKYGFWIGNRYKNDVNIIWILGGDRPAINDSNDWRPIWRQMAKGIIDATNKKCLISYHPNGGKNSTSQWIHREPWLNINMFQSGHGGGHDVACWELVKRDREYAPTKPTLDAEPNYEDHPVNPWPTWKVENGYFRDYDVRKQIYRSVFAGACGVTYGHHAMWQFFSEREEIVNYADRGWVNAMDRPGAFQAGYLKKLIQSRPQLGRIPDNSIIIAGQGETNSEHMEAFRGADNSYCMLYLPVGKKITVNLKFIKGKKINAWWFDPKNASVKKETLDKKDSMEFTPYKTGVGNDWVLIIDDADKNFGEP